MKHAEGSGHESCDNGIKDVTSRFCLREILHLLLVKEISLENPCERYS